MDKKKVKKLIEQINFIAHDFIDGDKQEVLQDLVSEVQEELNKSDWISVEDGLPEYGEDVLVYNKNFNKYLIAIRHHMGIDRQLDKNGFIKGLGITHWKPIEKLEE